LRSSLRHAGEPHPFDDALAPRLIEALRSTMALWTSIAQRTASTTLRNSMTLPSPRPRWMAMIGSR
jgi:hypothetical protein